MPALFLFRIQNLPLTRGHCGSVGGAVQPPTAPALDVFSSSYLEMVRDLHQMAQKSVING